MANKYYIYLHIKKNNGEPFYVGKGKDNRKSIKQHKSIFWHRIVNKYGYDIILLEKNLSEKEALEKEIYWIKRIGRRDKGLGPLCNLTDGGEGITGAKRSEEFKKNISKMMMGNKNPNYGKKLTEEHKKKLKKANKGKSIYGKNTKKVIDIYTGIIFDSISDAGRAYNIKYLSSKLRDKRPNKTNLRLL